MGSFHFWGWPTIMPTITIIYHDVRHCLCYHKQHSHLYRSHNRRGECWVIIAAQDYGIHQDKPEKKQNTTTVKGSSATMVLAPRSEATGARVVWLVAILPHEAGHEEAKYKHGFSPALKRECLWCHNTQGGQMGREYTHAHTQTDLNWWSKGLYLVQIPSECACQESWDDNN